jgi:diguanylate cyclase (GGDEF)-like protein/PAS domain S-box-containing protein
MSSSEDSAPKNGEEISQLRTARDAALMVAQSAIRDTTRLTRLLTILSENPPLDQLLDRMLSTLSELFAADIVVLLDPVSLGTFSPLAAIGLPEDIAQRPFSNAEKSYTAAAMKSNSPILLDNMEADQNVDSQLHDLNAKIGVWLPVIDDYATRGVLIMARCEPVPFTHHDIGLLSAMIYRIGLSLEQAQKNTQLEQVVQFGHEIRSYLDEAQVHAKAVSMFPLLIRADSTALLLRGASGKVTCMAHTGLKVTWDSDWELATEYLISSMDSSNVKPLKTADLHVAFEKTGIRPPWDNKKNAVLGIPILCEGQVQGMLYGIRFSTPEFNPNTLQIAMLYASQVSAAIENARLYLSVQNELFERKQAEHALRSSDDRFRALIRSVSDVICILTTEGRISYISPAAETSWGIPMEKLLSQNILNFIHPKDRVMFQELLEKLREIPNTTLTQTVRLRYRENDWRVFDAIFTNLLNEPAIAGIVVTYHDITERKIHEQKLKEMALRDSLTGLFNRSHFRELLHDALIRASTQNMSVAVIFIDLDNFKSVNDNLGHAWGDRLLQIIADRLQNCLRRADSAARLGGDEFTILVDTVTSLEQVMSIAHRLASSLNTPIKLNEGDFFVNGSLGIAVSIPNHDTADELLHKADIAMYAVKGQGKGSYAIFDPDLNAPRVGRFEDLSKP